MRLTRADARVKGWQKGSNNITNKASITDTPRWYVKTSAVERTGNGRACLKEIGRPNDRAHRSLEAEWAGTATRQDRAKSTVWAGHGGTCTCEIRRNNGSQNGTSISCITGTAGWNVEPVAKYWTGHSRTNTNEVRCANNRCNSATKSWQAEAAQGIPKTDATAVRRARHGRATSAEEQWSDASSHNIALETSITQTAVRDIKPMAV